MKKPFTYTKYNFIFFALIIIFSVWGFHGKAMAHRVTVFAWVDGDTVHTQSRFSGGKAVHNGRISVYGSQGKLLLEGNTDSDGEFDFSLPGTGNLRIVLNAGMGHVGEWVLSAEANGSTLEMGKETEPKTEKPSSGSKAVSTQSSKATTSSPVGLTRDEIKAIVDESIDNKLKPIMKLLVELHHEKPTFNDILSGIGYVLGLVGLGAYIHYRKNDKNKK